MSTVVDAGQSEFFTECRLTLHATPRSSYLPWHRRALNRELVELIALEPVGGSACRRQGCALSDPEHPLANYIRVFAYLPIDPEQAISQ